MIDRNLMVSLLLATKSAQLMPTDARQLTSQDQMLATLPCLPYTRGAVEIMVKSSEKVF